MEKEKQNNNNKESKKEEKFSKLSSSLKKNLARRKAVRKENSQFEQGTTSLRVTAGGVAISGGATNASPHEIATSLRSSQ